MLRDSARVMRSRHFKSRRPPRFCKIPAKLVVRSSVDAGFFRISSARAASASPASSRWKCPLSSRMRMVLRIARIPLMSAVQRVRATERCNLESRLGCFHHGKSDPQLGGTGAASSEGNCGSSSNCNGMPTADGTCINVGKRKSRAD